VIAAKSVDRVARSHAITDSATDTACSSGPPALRLQLYAAQFHLDFDPCGHVIQVRHLSEYYNFFMVEDNI
jgi:hypothetical protein